MKKTLTLLAVFVVLAACVSTTVDAANKSRIGSAGAQELLIPVGARGIAIGGSSMVFSSGAEAIYWNPAGLGRMQHSVEATLSQMSYLADLNVTYGAVGVQAGEFGTIGFTLKSLSFGDIPVTTTLFPDGTGENYSPTFMTLGVTYAKLLTDRIAVGLTANLVSEQILSTSATGMAFTIGIQYQNLAVQGLNIGIAVRNFGPNMKFDGSNLLHAAEATEGLRGSQQYKVEAASFELPSSMEIGLGYTRKLDERNGILFGAMFRNNNYQDDEYNLGMEYNFDEIVFVRGGYTFAPQADKDVTGASTYIYDYTLGAGIHYAVGGVDLTFDYAYRHVDYFDGENVFSLKIGF